MPSSRFGCCARGYSGLHVDASFGHGVMPLTFEALKGQRFRWCFGGIQILRRNWRYLMPGRRERDNQLSPGQRWAYLSGAVQWYGDLLALIFFVFLLAGAANLALHGDLLLRKLTGFLLAAIPLLVLLGLVRAVALLRRGTQASWSDAFGAFMIWQCTSLVVARASVQALYAKEAEFLRTPKTMEEGRFWDAIKGNRGETILGLLGVLGIVAALTNTSGYGGPLTAALLVWPTFAFLAAPYNSRAAQRAALPPELAARRRSELLRMTPRRATVAAGSSLVLAGTVAAVVVALLAPGHRQVLGPQLLPPARGSCGAVQGLRHALALAGSVVRHPPRHGRQRDDGHAGAHGAADQPRAERLAEPQHEHVDEHRTVTQPVGRAIIQRRRRWRAPAGGGASSSP